MNTTISKRKKLVLSSLIMLCQAMWMVSACQAESTAEVRVNRSHGRVISSDHQDGADLHIIHIQDAHCNLEAQHNIVNLLNELVKNYDVKLVGVEGAAGRFDTGRIAGFPDREIVQNVTEYFLKAGKISGSEYFSINYNQPNILLGIEDSGLYLENYSMFLKSMEVRTAAIEYFSTVKEDLKMIQEKCTSETIWNFNNQASLLQDEQNDFTAFCQLLEKYRDENNIGIDSYSNFAKLMETIRLESTIDFDRINLEKGQLLDALSEVLGKQELAQLLQNNLYFRINRITPSEYYQYLLKVGTDREINFEQYPNFMTYTTYLATYDSIDQKALFRECDDLKSAIRLAMCATEDDEQICQLIESAQLWEKYTTLQLSTADLQKFKQQAGMSIEEFDKKMDAYCNKLNLPCSENTALIQTIAGSMTMLDKFYQVAKKRDAALVEQLIAEMDLEGINTAILIAGGFHTEGILQELEAQGISYDVVIPEITRAQENNPYFSLMANIRTPFEEVLASNTLQLALKTAKMNLLDQADQVVFAKELDALLTAMTADSRMAQSLNEVEMIEQVNRVLQDYDTPFDIRVLGRVTSFGREGYRGYLLEIDGQRFTFQVQDKLQFDSSRPVENMYQAEVQDKVVTVMPEDDFQELVDLRMGSAEVNADIYDVALSAELRKQMTYKAIDNLFETLYNLGEITPRDIDNEVRAIGVDVRPEIRSFMQYFLDRGIVKIAQGTKPNEQVYTWINEYAQVNRITLEQYMTRYPTEISGRLLVASEVKFMGGFLNENNKLTTGKIRYYFFESNLPTDILYRIMAELHDGRPELFDKSKPSRVEFESTNGKTYEISVVYRPEDKAFFFRAGLKEDPSQPVTQLVEPGRAIAESPVISLERKGVKVATSNPFDYETVGVTKVFLRKNPQTGHVDLHAKVFKVDKATRAVVGVIDDMSFVREIPQDTGKLPAEFAKIITDVVAQAERNNIGLLRPVLDAPLLRVLPPDEVDRSMIEVGIAYDEVDLATFRIEPFQGGDVTRVTSSHPMELAYRDAPGAYGDLMSIAGAFIDQAQLDQIRQDDNRVTLLSEFYREATAKMNQILSVLYEQYGLQYPVDVTIKLAPGPLADSSFTPEAGYKIYLNAHAFRSPGLLFAQLEHELRHAIAKQHAQGALEAVMPADQVTPRMVDFITEMYVTGKELERYDQFGMDAQLGLQTKRALEAVDNPIDPQGRFYQLLQLDGEERTDALLDAVAQRYFGDATALPTQEIVENALNELDSILASLDKSGAFAVTLNERGQFTPVTAEVRQSSREAAQALIDNKAASISQPETLFISPTAQIGHLVTIGADASIIGDNITIGRKVSIGKGAKIISDGGTINIEEGAMIDDGVVIRAKVGETITIGPGTMILKGASIAGNTSTGHNTLIETSSVKNATVADNAKIVGSDVWGQTDNPVVIASDVQVLYSKLRSLDRAHAQTVDLLDRGVSEPFATIFSPEKYRVEATQTRVGAGTVIEKAEIINSKIGSKVTVRENARVAHSIIEDNSVARVNADITLTYMGREVEVGSVVEKCYFGDGSKSEHQGSQLQHLIMPNEYPVLDENGNMKRILVPNTSNIGAGTIIENMTGIPVIGYNLFTGINSKVVTSEDNPTVIYPFTLTKDTTGGELLPFAYSQKVGQSIEAWMLDSYVGAIINHHKKTLSLVKKLGYPMADFDLLFSGTLRLAVTRLQDRINGLYTEYNTAALPRHRTPEEIRKDIDALETAWRSLTANLESRAWHLQDGQFINGNFAWHPGDKWSTPTLDAFAKMQTADLKSFTDLYAFLGENLQVPAEFQPESFEGEAEMGTDGIRGVATDAKVIDDSHVTPVMGYRLGLVAALYAATQGKDMIYVGGDTRPSTTYLLDPVRVAALSLGIDVKHAPTGVDHTPGVQYKVLADPQAGGGLVVTASHNPAKDNGFKLLTETGSKIPAQWESIANRIVNAKDLAHEMALVMQELGGTAAFQKYLDNLADMKQGQLFDAETSLDEQYAQEMVDALKALIPADAASTTFVIDTASGAGVRLLEIIDSKLDQIPNFNIELINTEGTINQERGAEYIHKKLTKDIAAGKPLPQWIADHKGEVIGTLDGDADRNLLVRVNDDNSVEVIDGDKFAALKAYVLQRYIQEAGLADQFQVGAAQTVLANMGSASFFKRLGIPVQETKVGDKYVREAADKWALGDPATGQPAHGVAVYYEAAGHGSIIFSDSFIDAVSNAAPSQAKDILQAMIDMQNMAGGDGIRNLILFRALMMRENLSFDQLNDPNYLYPEVPKIELELKVKYKNNVKSVENLGKEVTGPEDLVQAIADWQQRLGDQYRIIIRASGTSPKVRVQVDGPDTALIEEAAYDLMQSIYDSPNIIGDPAEPQPKDRLAAINENRRKEQQAKQIAAFQAENLDQIVQTIRGKFTEDQRYAPTEVTGKAEVGTDGIRGKALESPVLNNKNITPTVAYRMGITSALHAWSQGKPVIHVAGDTRPSSDYLMDAFIAGAQQMGVEVRVDGPSRVASTPQLQLFARQDEAAGAGGIITASHNPAPDNGIKLIDQTGGKISADWERITNEIVNSTDLATTIGRVVSTFQTSGQIDRNKINLALDNIGTPGAIITQEDAAVDQIGGNTSYVERVVQGLATLSQMARAENPDLEPGTFVIDSASGAGVNTVGEIAQRFNELFAQGQVNYTMDVINTDGVINEEKGAEFIHKELGKEIAAGKALPQWIDERKGIPMGTLDGDADRNLLFRVTEEGDLQVIDGDKFAAYKAKVLDKYLGILGLDETFQVGVAQTVLANLGSKGFFERMGIQVQETAVGDKYVRAAALDWANDHGVAIYYEAAGHGSIVFNDTFVDTIAQFQPQTDEQARAKTIVQTIVDLQNEAGGDGIMNLLLFRALMELENISFDQLNSDEFLYRELPKTELELRVEHKENVTSVGNLGKELTGPQDVVDYVANIQKELAQELDARLARGELTEADLPVREFRVIVRYSGTSPKVRVQVDGPVADMAQKAAYQIMQAIYDSENVKGVESEPRPMDQYNEIVEAQKQKMLAELTLTMEDGAEFIHGWDQLTESEQIDVLLDLSRNGFTREKLEKLIDVHAKGGEQAIEAPEEPATFDAPDMKDISRDSVDQRQDAIALGQQKDNVDRAALVVIAGGDGGRLLTNMGFTEEEKPAWSKPTIPVTAVAKKPPLQRIIETMAKVRREQNSDIPIVIVVGPKSRGPIETFLANNDYFGIDNIIVVEQGRYPVLKSMEEGQPAKLILTPEKHVEYNPDGTGGIVDVMGTSVTVAGEQYDTVVDYLDSVNRDKVIFWGGDVPGLTTDLFYGILGVSKGVTGTEDVDVVGLAYASDNKKLGTMVMMNGQRVLVIESVDRASYPGLEEADDTTDGKMGLPRNSGGYMMSLAAIKDVIDNFPVHLQSNKDINGIDLATGQPILKADKMEKFFPDIFPLVTQNPDRAVIIAVADEKDMVPQKSIPQLHKASQELVKQDKQQFIDQYGMGIHESAVLDVSPLYQGSIGSNVFLGENAELYIGENVNLGPNVLIGKDSTVRGEHITFGRGVVVTNGSNIVVEGSGELVIADGTIIDGNVSIRVRDGETVHIGPNSRITNDTVITGQVAIGPRAQLDAAKIEYANLAGGVKVEESTVQGISAKLPVIVGNDVVISGQSVITNLAKAKKWSFLETGDLDETFTPVDEFVLRRYAVDASQSVIGDGAVIHDARIKNTVIGERTIVGPSVAIEHSQIGNEVQIGEGANITVSYIADKAVIASEVSKSYLGVGFVTEGKQTYLSTIAPNEFIIADEQGNVQVLQVPNPTVIENGTVFANYGGKPLPDLSGSQKGTSFIYAASIRDNVVNLYDHPDVHLVDLVNQPNVTVIYPFSKTNNEVWGTVLPFTEAQSLSPSTHKIGAVLDSDPAMIVDMVRRMHDALPDNRKHLANQVVEGSLWLGVKLINDQLSALNAKLAKQPENAKLLKRKAQLEQGLATYQKHLDGRWADPLSVDHSAIAMNDYDPSRQTVEFVRVFGNPDVITLEGREIDAMKTDPAVVEQITAIMDDMGLDRIPQLQQRYAEAQTAEEKVKLFVDVARDRLSAIRNILRERYRGVDDLTFVIALGSERLAERNVSGDRRIVVNAHALRSPALMFSQAEHELFHELVEVAVSDTIESSNTKNNDLVETIFQRQVMAEGVTADDAADQVQIRTENFFRKLKEFMAEDFIIGKELDRIHSMSQPVRQSILGVLRDPANPIDQGMRFAELVESTVEMPYAEKRKAVQEFILRNYDGMGIVGSTLDAMRSLRENIDAGKQVGVPITIDDVDLLYIVDDGVKPDNTVYDGMMPVQWQHYFESAVRPFMVNDDFIVDVDRQDNLASYVTELPAADVARSERPDISAIDFDVFGDSKIADSNSLFLSDALRKLSENAQQNGRLSKVLIFSMRQDAAAIREYLDFRGVDLATVAIVDRSDIIVMAGTMAQANDKYMDVYTILDEAARSDDYSALDRLYTRIEESDPAALAFGSNLIDVLLSKLSQTADIPGVDATDIKLAVGKQALVQVAVANNVRTISWDTIGQDMVQEGDLIEAGIDNILLLQVLEPGSEVPGELVVTAVAPDKVINGVKVHDVFTQEQNRRKEAGVQEPVTIGFLVDALGISYLTKEDIKGIAVKAPKREIDREFSEKLRRQQLFDQSA